MRRYTIRLTYALGHAALKELHADANYEVTELAPSANAAAFQLARKIVPLLEANMVEVGKVEEPPLPEVVEEAENA